MQKKEQVSEIDSLILCARLQKIISQINPSIYPFQLENLLKNVFGRLDNYFIGKVGFSVFLYLDFPWKSDPKMDELLKIYPFKRKGETCVDD